MTSLDSILKSRDITLLIKVRIVKAMVFPVVMYECESWTINKTQHCWGLWNVVLEKTLQCPLDCKEIKQVNPKEVNPEHSLERLRLKLKFQHCGHRMQRANSMEKTLMLGKIESKRRREQQRMRWLDSITNSTDMNLSKLLETVKDRGAWHAVIHGVTKSWTWLMDWTTTKTTRKHITKW